eukprot:gene847-1648_t
MQSQSENTVGFYLAKRLSDVNLKCFFCVAGDFNLLMLDKFVSNPDLRMITCCNELNAAYAADGYARIHGFAVVVVTYMVGGLSAINAIAGSFSDDLPVLIISGAPNSNDSIGNKIVHHTIGKPGPYEQARCFSPLVKTFCVSDIKTSQEIIDDSILTCISSKKPVYLEVACNIVPMTVSIPNYSLRRPSAKEPSDLYALSAAVEEARKQIEASLKPVIIGGVKLRSGDGINAFQKLVEVIAAPVAMMPDAKGLFPENHPQYIGCYWGCASSHLCPNIVESADCLIFAGPVFNDYSTAGWTALIPESKLIAVYSNHVIIRGACYSNVRLKDFLQALRAVAPKRDASHVAYKRSFQAPRPPLALSQDAGLTMLEFCRQVQNTLTSDTELLVETGDSWFIGQRMSLPDGANYHIQMQYGSIGWSVGAVLGLAVDLPKNRQLLALIGDGSFQLTCQELSTMIRENVHAIIFLINNGGYTIEVEIHDGPYNKIQNWNYTHLIKCFSAGRGNGALGLSAKTAGELSQAIAKAKACPGLALIECHLHRDDCTAELLVWGSKVAAANSKA